ncbi:MAG: hypothetical protein Q8Q01_01595 [archaeon]|nr:hypothetical protein [archaeon]
MVKKFIIVTLIVLTIILIGCKPGETSSDSLDNASIIGGSDVETTNENLPEGQCLPQWKCVSSTYKAFQSEDCSFGEKTECKLGCEDGKCHLPATCERKFACKNTRDKGLQVEDCSWVGVIQCEWGCSENACNPEPEPSNVTTSTVNETEEVIPKATVYSVKQGESISLSAGGTEHNISIYIIETGKARLNVDQYKTEWLEEGGNATFSTGITIYIKEILFQPYDGGQRSVGFTTE